MSADSRPRLRWWMWMALAITVLAAAMTAVRLHGFATLADTEAALTARGLPDLTAFLASAPTGDADRQERLARLLLSQGSWGDKPPQLPFRELREARPQAGNLKQLDGFVASGRASIRDLEAILDDGPVCLGLTGWLPRNPAAVRRLSPQEIWQRQTGLALMSSRAWLNWYGIQACLADDPAPYLHRIDQLHAALLEPGCVLDAMVSIACSSIRDQIRLWLATRGRLEVPRMQAWMAEHPQQMAWMRRGLAGERICGAAQLTRMRWEDLCIAVDPATTPHAAPSWQGRLLGAMIWPVIGHEAVVGVDAIAIVEERAAGLPSRPAATMPAGLASRLGSQYGYSDEFLVTGFEAAYAHRLNRIIAICAALRRSGGALPAEERTLADLMPTGLLAERSANEPAIRYERLSESRIRCGLDPSAAKPPIIPATRWTATTVAGSSGYGTGVGSPAATAPYVWMRWSVEVDLDAILVPPPAPTPRRPKP